MKDTEFLALQDLFLEKVFFFTTKKYNPHREIFKAIYLAGYAVSNHFSRMNVDGSGSMQAFSLTGDDQNQLTCILSTHNNIPDFEIRFMEFDGPTHQLGIINEPNLSKVYYLTDYSHKGVMSFNMAFGLPTEVSYTMKTGVYPATPISEIHSITSTALMFLNLSTFTQQQLIDRTDLYGLRYDASRLTF